MARGVSTCVLGEIEDVGAFSVAPGRKQLAVFEQLVVQNHEQLRNIEPHQRHPVTLFT